jgi:hypothetical protein
MGDLCNEALSGCGLGWFVDNRAGSEFKIGLEMAGAQA